MSWMLMCGVIGLDFILRWCGKESFNDVSIAIIGFVTVFINGGYITQNIFRDTSLNKNGIYFPDGGTKHYMNGGESNDSDNRPI
jgi:hypothetical protein